MGIALNKRINFFLSSLVILAISLSSYVQSVSLYILIDRSCIFVLDLFLGSHCVLSNFLRLYGQTLKDLHYCNATTNLFLVSLPSSFPVLGTFWSVSPMGFQFFCLHLTACLLIFHPHPHHCHYFFAIHLFTFSVMHEKI